MGVPRCDGIARAQQAIGFQRLEDVTHCCCATLNRIQVEFACGLRISAHSPHQVLMRNPFVVDEHAIGHWIVITNDGVHQFMDERIGLKPECLHCEGNHRGEEGGTWHLSVLLQPSLEAASDALSLRHSAETGRMLHHTLTFGDGELTEKKVALARSRGDPIGIATAGIQESRLSCSRCLLGEFDEFIFDFERAKSFEGREGSWNP